MRSCRPHLLLRAGEPLVRVRVGVGVRVTARVRVRVRVRVREVAGQSLYLP